MKPVLECELARVVDQAYGICEQVPDQFLRISGQVRGDTHELAQNILLPRNIRDYRQ
ncbi:MAG: hypothetical protein KAG66_14125 [Methylococcales bacterium]|nr:hypothetical protein [Methylococcales bacterium]